MALGARLWLHITNRTLNLQERKIWIKRWGSPEMRFDFEHGKASSSSSSVLLMLVDVNAVEMSQGPASKLGLA